MVLSNRMPIEEPGHDSKEDWPECRPEGSLQVVIQDWLDAGKDDSETNNDLNEDHQNICPEAVLEDYKIMWNPLLLEDWEGADQEDVWRTGGNIYHVGQNPVEGARCGSPERDQEDDAANEDRLHPHSKGRHPVFVQLSNPGRP